MRTTSSFIVLLLVQLHFISAQEQIVHDVGHLLHFGFEEGLEMLDNNMVSNPMSPIHLIKRAKYLEMQGQTAEAAEDLRLAQYLSPFMVDLYYHTNIQGRRKLISMLPEKDLLTFDLMSSVSIYANRLEDAYVNNRIPQLAFYQLNEAIDHLIIGDSENALTTINRYLLANPKSTWALDLKGIVLTESQSYEQARAVLEQALSIDPVHANAWYNLSVVDFRQGFISSAHNALEHALEADTSLSSAYFSKAMISESEGDYEEALTAYTDLLLKGDYMTGQALANRGLIKKMMGDFHGSLEDLNAALCIHPNNAVLYKNRGNLHLLHGDFLAAITDYDAALKLKPSYPTAQHNRAMAKLLLHDFEGGCIDLRESAAQGYQYAIEKKQSFCHTLPK